MPKLGDIAEVRTGYPFRRRVERRERSGCGLVQMSDVDQADCAVRDVTTWIEPPANHHEHSLQKADVLLVARGVQNHAAMYVADADCAVASPQLFVLRPTRVEFADYLTWFLNLPRTRETLRSLQRGSAVPFVALGALRDLEVPLPSVAIQNSIIELHRLQLREQELLRRIGAERQRLVDELLLEAAQVKRTS